jgi:CDP-6-deoxy-D-xylo-4-hexulose-3-dehydrase
MKYSFFVEAAVEEKLAKFIIDEPILSMGKQTLIFQEMFADWHSRKHCVMVNSGSSANLILLASLLNLGRLKKGAKVGVSGVTWSTNIMPIMQLGLTPILLDVESDDVNIGPASVLTKIKDLDALFVTNVLGLDNYLPEISSLCSDNGVLLLEDNCEALGCRKDGIFMGNFGLASTASSFIGHHFSTIEGGYVFTDDDELAAMLKVVRAHGWTRNLSSNEMKVIGSSSVAEFERPYTFEYCGFNVRPSELNAYCGILQLPLIYKYNNIRQDRFRLASSLLGSKLYSSSTDNPVFAIPIKTSDQQEKAELIRELKKAEIECRPLISGSMGRQPFWKKAYGEQTLPNATLVDERGLYVTNDPQLSDDEFSRVLSCLAEALL